MGYICDEILCLSTISYILYITIIYSNKESNIKNTYKLDGAKIGQQEEDRRQQKYSGSGIESLKYL